MSQLYDGIWRDSPPAAEEIGEDGQFRRIESPLRNWISADPGAEFPAEAGRYHLFVAWVCPWASRVTALSGCRIEPCPALPEAVSRIQAIPFSAASMR